MTRPAWNWTAISGIGGLLATVIAVVAIALGFWQYSNPRGADATPGSLSLISAEISSGAEIDYDQSSPDGAELAAGGYSITDNVIDIIVRNTGGSSVLVTAVEASVSLAHELDGCRDPFGGEGFLFAAADYTIAVPVDVQQIGTIELQKAVPVEIPANSLGRLTATVGPETVSQIKTPWVYIVDLRIRTDAQSIDIGRYSLISPTSQIPQISYGDITRDPVEVSECAMKELTYVEAALNSDGSIAPELTRVLAGYKDLATGVLEGE